MRTLARTALSPTATTDALPQVFSAFERFGIEIRRGAMTMFAATPASGKSFLVLKLAMNMGLDTLYFSADTSPQDQLERAAAMATGHHQRAVRQSMLAGGEDYYAEQLSDKFGHIRWVFESAPTYEDLELETAAYAEAFGRFPEIIIIDNLVNVIGDGDGEYASQKESTRVMHRLVRITGCSLWLVHHMNEKKALPSYPSPRTDLANRLAQLPEQILSIASDDTEGLMRVAVVKNRTGRQDPSGQTYCTLYTDLDTGSFYATPQARETGFKI